MLTRETELELYAAVAAGSGEARQQLILSLNRLGKRIAMRMCASCPQCRGDMVQEAMLAACEVVDEFRPERGRLVSYAYRYIQGRIYTALRQRYDALPSGPTEELIDCDDSAPEAAARLETVQAVRGFLETFDERTRDVLLARVDGESFTDIGRRWHITRQRVVCVWREGVERLTILLANSSLAGVNIERAA